MTLRLPAGWVVHERADGRFAVTDAPLGTPEDPGEGEAGVFIVRDPSDSADRWRDLVEREGWTLESDTVVSVGGVPATSLVFEHTDARVPTREQVVVVPSRDLTIILQPIPYGQRQDGPRIFEEHRAEFEAILDSLEFGSPGRT